MLVRSVVDHQVDDDPDPAAVRRLQERREVAECAQPGVHVVIVGDLVAAVAARGGMDRVQPQAVDAEPGQVVQPAGQPGEVTGAIAVGVLERFRVQAVDDRILVPALSHADQYSPQLTAANAFRGIFTRLPGPLRNPPMTDEDDGAQGCRETTR